MYTPICICIYIYIYIYIYIGGSTPSTMTSFSPMDAAPVAANMLCYVISYHSIGISVIHNVMLCNVLLSTIILYHIILYSESAQFMCFDRGTFRVLPLTYFYPAAESGVYTHVCVYIYIYICVHLYMCMHMII